MDAGCGYRITAAVVIILRCTAIDVVWRHVRKNITRVRVGKHTIYFLYMKNKNIYLIYMPTTKHVEMYHRKTREKKVKIYAIRGVDGRRWTRFDR